MRRLSAAAFALLLSVAASAHADLSPTGRSAETPLAVTDDVSVLGGCRVLWYGIAQVGELSRLGSLGLTVTQTTNASALAIANLVNYEILVVSLMGPVYISFYQRDIQQFVGGGGGLMIHQPNMHGTIDYAPAGFEVTIESNVWCGGLNDYVSTIVDSSHPITAGLTDADLAADFDRASSVGAGYTVLAVNAVCRNPSLAAGNYASGRVVFETGMVSLNSAVPGSALYWTRVFDWLCAPGPVSTDAASWGDVKARYRD